MAFKRNNSGFYVDSAGKTYDAASGWSSSGDGKTLTNSYTGQTVTDKTASPGGGIKSDAPVSAGAGATSGGRSPKSRKAASSTVENANAALQSAAMASVNAPSGPVSIYDGVTDQASALSKMMQNSDSWLTADGANRTMLALDNNALASKFFPGATRDPGTGIWYYNGSPLYEQNFSGTGTPGTVIPNIGVTGAYMAGIQADPNAQLEPIVQTPFNTTSDPVIYSTIQQMKMNSQQWLNADEETRKKLAAENKQLAQSIPGAYIGADGVWYYGGEKLYDMAYQAPQTWQMPEMPESLQNLAGRLDSMDESLRNYASFTYDPNSDPLYKQYADVYARNGSRAMDDVMARMAARTGGMASSYAGYVAQQTYDQYMADLASKIPELQQLAYSMYVDDYNRDVGDYNRAYDRYVTEYNNYYNSAVDDYNRYRDTVEDRQWETENRQNQAQQALQNERYNTEWAYQQEQDRSVQQNTQTEQQAQSRSELYDMAAKGYIPTQEDADRCGLSGTELLQLQLWARERNRQQNDRYYAYYGY